MLVALWLGVPLYAEQRATHPYIGITYIDRTESAPRAVHMHLVQIDLAAPGLRFKLSPPAGAREVIRQTTLEFLEQEHAQLAVNAHYFLPFPSTDTDAWVIGIAASDGRVYSAFESPEQDYALVADAPGVNIDRDNHATIVHRDRAQADGAARREPVALWTTVAGSAQIVTAGATSIPDLAWYRAVQARTAIGLSGDGRTLTLFTVDKSGGQRGDGGRRGRRAVACVITVSGTRSISTGADRRRWRSRIRRRTGRRWSTLRRTTRRGGRLAAAWRCSRGQSLIPNP